MINWKVLFGVLVVWVCYCFSYNTAFASEVETAPVLVAPAPEPAPAQSETSPNLIDNNNWDGATYGADPGGCCSSISGSGALYDTNTDTIMFSYGRDVLAQTIAINEALKLSGIEVDGFNYGWSWRTISNNGNGGDTLQFEVTVKDAAGNEVERYVYDYSSPDHGMDVWHTESGTEIFKQSYLDPQNIQLKITGKDGGFWAGYYGPEVKDVDLRLIFRANPCATDPLYDTSCPGYADAYAIQQYEQQCQANPLYDIGCSGYDQAYQDQQCSIDALYSPSCAGYTEAYFEYQCSIDPLYDMGCSGYQTAYYNNQCSLNPLYDTGCNGYADAYYNQQCSLDPLYDNQCPGYATAYYNQQCGLDSLYDAGCPGYEEAYFAKYIQPELDKQAEQAAGISTDSDLTATGTTETVATADSVAELTQPSATGDATVDSVIKTDTATTGVATTGAAAAIQQSIGSVDTAPAGSTSVGTTAKVESSTETSNESSQEQQVEAELEVEIASLEDSSEGGESDDGKSESSGDVDESVEESGDSEKSDSEQSDGGSSKDDSSGGDKSGKSDRKEPTEKQKQDSKREKIKKIITEKLKNLAQDMGNAASLEQQQAIQAQINALIAYVPGFNAYGQLAIPGVDFYSDQSFYPDERVPESRRGLRNGLAQQILHEKMVDMQYK